MGPSLYRGTHLYLYIYIWDLLYRGFLYRELPVYRETLCWGSLTKGALDIGKSAI